jgi:hypothetical protein
MTSSSSIETCVAHHEPYRPMLRRAQKQSLSLLGRIERALAEGLPHKAKHLQNRYFNSRGAKIAALTAANRRSPNHLRISGQALLSLVAQMNVRRDCGEVITCYAKRRLRRSPRLIHSYGLIRRAQQILVKRAMRPFCSIDDRAYLQVGRDRAVEHFVDMCEQNGFKWVAEADIQNFFPSIEHEPLARLLPVDRSVFDRVIVSERAERVYDRSRLLASGTDTFAFARGLPQGAITSSLVSDVLVSHRLRSLPGDFGVMNYGDNFYIGARTKEELFQKIQTLLASFARGSVQPLVFDLKLARRVDWGFNCLGYKMKITRYGTEVRPSNVNLRKFIRKSERLANALEGRGAPFRFLR